jgi:large subunit ribosomal protein L22
MSTPRAQARLRYLLSSPPKVRQVCGLIQGLEIEQARQQLELTTRAASTEVLKLLDSAVANAEHAANLPEDELFVERAVVDEGPTLRRWRPRARGRATRVHKRTSHVTIVVARLPDDELERRRRRDAARGRMVPRRRPRVRRRQTEDEEHDHEHESEKATAAEDAVMVDDAEEPVAAPAAEIEEEEYEEPDLSAVPDYEDIKDDDEKE